MHDHLLTDRRENNREIPTGAYSLHEDLHRHVEVRSSSDRAFGLIVGGVFSLIALWPLVRGRSVRPWALAVGAILVVLAVIAPAALAPLNRVWTRLGLLLQRITSPVVLGLLFYLTITPIGVVMRLLGKTPLQLSLDRAAPSYWIPRRPPGPAPHTMRQQF